MKACYCKFDSNETSEILPLPNNYCGRSDEGNILTSGRLSFVGVDRDGKLHRRPTGDIIPLGTKVQCTNCQEYFGVAVSLEAHVKTHRLDGKKTNWLSALWRKIWRKDVC